jgi:hypothetical protein
VQNFNADFYELHQFLGGYFHQFWKESYNWHGEKPNFEAVVKFYKSSDAPESVAETTEELRHFLSLNLSEKEIHDLFVKKNGIWYVPSSRNMNYRQWLEAILGILEEENITKTSMKRRDDVSFIPIVARNGEVIIEQPLRRYNVQN